MTNEEIAINILNRRGHNVSAALDEHNYGEFKSVIIQALDLADEANHRKAVKLIEPLDKGLKAEVKAVIERKGGKK